MEYPIHPQFLSWNIPKYLSSQLSIPNAFIYILIYTLHFGKNKNQYPLKVMLIHETIRKDDF